MTNRFLVLNIAGNLRVMRNSVDLKIKYKSVGDVVNT
jgi:hypothetical protein